MKPLLCILAAVAAGAYVLASSAAFMWGVRFRLRRARRLALAGHHREADRTLNAVAAACERFRAAHPEWVRP